MKERKDIFPEILLASNFMLDRIATGYSIEAFFSAIGKNTFLSNLISAHVNTRSQYIKMK